VRFLKGVGEARERALSRLGVKTAEDLLFFFPRRYEDRREITPFSALIGGRVMSVIAEVVAFEKRSASRGGLEISSAILGDGKDLIRAVWFNMPWLEDVLTSGTRVALYGKVEVRGGIQLRSPELEVLDESDPESVGRVVAVYPTAAGLSQRWIRRVVSSTLDLYLCRVRDCVPPETLWRLSLPKLRESIAELHRPRDRESWLRARNRLAFDELFLLQAALLLRKKKHVAARKDAPSFVQGKPGEKFSAFLRSLPFPLTGAQRRVIGEIVSDMDSETPMNRLLQGDVGSGKTAVAVASLVVAADSGAQAALMVPTEILAHQHYFRLKTWLSDLGIRAELLTGSLSKAGRRETLGALASGEAQIVIGTHALFGPKVIFKRLGLVVVDEQHRFGVLQKNTLLMKTRSPHVLVMTATPIPRTLTLSIYGDLDVSVLDELPPGRKPVKTVLFRASGRASLARLLSLVHEAAERGRQIYWVCPLIEESDKLDLSAAYSRFQALKEDLPDLRVALVHGQLPVDERDAAMRAFSAGEVDLLVATSVIEVGVDVPNATVMVIEDASRFGMAQLHQLRGRVGRGEEESLCVLLSGKLTPEGAARLNAMLSSSDGFKIAEMDLKQRGPGEVCGVRQHGVTDFRVADLTRDQDLLLLARKEAAILLDADPNLNGSPYLREALARRLSASLSLALTP
jgi:ATP-dependent DNA helicase RecG